MIRNLAIKGGGVRGIAFVGVLKELDTANILNGIERVAGTSAGAMVAAMICAGYSVAQISQLMYSLDFSKFEDEYNPLRIATHYGLYGGDYILSFVHQFFQQSPNQLTEDATFLQLKNAGCKELFLFATDLNTFSVAEFSADKTPDVKVAEAVRASMSIPLFFKAWQFSDSQPNDHLYVDGGVIFNYPLTFFDSPRFYSGNDDINIESLGLFLKSKLQICARELHFDQFLHFTRHLFETLLNTQDLDFEEDDGQQTRSIVIDDLGILATDFHLTADDMANLVESGSISAKQYLQKVNYQ